MGVGKVFRSLKHTPELVTGPLLNWLKGKVKTFRTDQGSEFHNGKTDELLKNLFVKRESACSDDQHQNGISERTLGVLFEMARTFIAESKLPLQFWGEVIMCAAYLRNRLPITTNPFGSSPYKLRYNKQPDLRKLRPFGVRCTVLKHQRNRGGAKARPDRGLKGIMVGYGARVGLKGYRVYLPDKGTIVTAPNVLFSHDMMDSLRMRPKELIAMDDVNALQHKENFDDGRVQEQAPAPTSQDEPADPKPNSSTPVETNFVAQPKIRSQLIRAIGDQPISDDPRTDPDEIGSHAEVGTDVCPPAESCVPPSAELTKPEIEYVDPTTGQRKWVLGIS
jgi:hypothetical protein